MDALLEAPPRPLTFADLARFSQQLADDVGRLPLRRSGYTVADYLSLDGNYLVEYVSGRLQVLPMPDALHQALTVVLLRLLDGWATVADAAARSVQAPFRVYLTDQLWREPDVAFMLGSHASRREDDRWDGADLVVEIISQTNREHDVTTKRADYAAAGIPEYWIIDPEPRTVRVLTLPAGATEYAVHGDFGVGQTAASPLLAGFAVDVADLFAAAQRRCD
jgi:Uma2 family endonuclease